MKAILFDLYGTLIDIHTDESSISFWTRLAAKTKKFKEYDPTQLKSKYLEICKTKESAREEIEILDVFMELYDVDREKAIYIAKLFRSLSTIYIRLYSRVKRLLKELKKNGFQLYILSNAQESFTMPELKKLGILPFFNGIAISSSYGVKKPNKEFFRKALNDFNLTEAVMIGNEYGCDIEPAKQLGLKTIYIESNLTFEKKEKPDFYTLDGVYQAIQNLY